MSINYPTLVRVANKMKPPLTLYEGKIPKYEYARIVWWIKNEPLD